MRKTASRIAALLLAAMTLQLFACGNDAGTTNTGNDTSSGDTETTAPETTLSVPRVRPATLSTTRSISAMRRSPTAST